MNIDVKNAYTEVIKSCEISDQELFISDIYHFIDYISLEGAKERFDDFCRTYIQREISSDMQKHKTDVCASYRGGKYKDIIDFFTVLGKYYIFSKEDKNQIDKIRYTEFIRKLRIEMSQTTMDKINAPKTKTSVEKAEREQIKVINEKEEKKENIQKEKNNEVEEENTEPEETLEELMEQLNSLIGLDGVKQEVEQIINLVRVQKKGEELGEKVVPLSLHLVFYGNPGTGKTTVARLLSKIYKALGVLSQGQLKETDRGKLVGGYVGQTAIKTQEVIDEAMGGILFIDEAYTLTHGKGENDFGQEAVDTILKAMEDHREDFIVIVAGYPDLMKEFINSNPGLKSRFNQYINFEDYTPEQLLAIFELLCSKQNLSLDSECKEFALNYFDDLYKNRSDDYANGRDVRNYFEKVIKMRANRLNPILDTITLDEYRTVTISDLENAKQIKESSW